MVEMLRMFVKHFLTTNDKQEMIVSHIFYILKSCYNLCDYF